MATPSFDLFNLDWRTRTPCLEIIEKLDRILTDLDSTGTMIVHLVNSTAKRLFTPEESGQRSHMIRQRIVSSKKKYQHGSGKSANNTDKYLARAKIVISLVVRMIEAKQPTTPRALWYKLRDGENSQPQIDQICKDLALSIEVHPYQLGIIPEVNQSFVRVPAGVDLKVTEVTNIFAYASGAQNVKDGLRTTQHLGGSHFAIAAMCLSVVVSQAVQTLRAVVVTEHRSVKEKIENQLDKPGFEGILLVMTGGFPDAACREFLHLLASSEATKDVPFVWMSDCDAHSLSMYSVIKYGSMHQAYASPSMVCPQLLFGGMTMERFENFANGYPLRSIASKEQRRPLTNDDKEQILRTKTAYVRQKLAILKGLPSSQVSRGDKLRITGLRKAKTMELPNEELGLAQLQQFEKSGNTLSFLRLEEFEETGIAFFVAEQVAAARNEAFAHSAAFGDFSQTRAAWIAAGSQTMSVPTQTPAPTTLEFLDTSLFE